MESQTYGTPVIGANIGGIPELIQNDITGLLFQSGSEQDLAEKISYLWENKDKNEKMHESCKNVNFYKIKEYYEKIFGVYEATK